MASSSDFHPNPIIIDQINGSRGYDEGPFFQPANDFHHSTGFQADAHRRQDCTPVRVNHKDTCILTKWIYDGDSGNGQSGFFYLDMHETSEPRLELQIGIVDGHVSCEGTSLWVDAGIEMFDGALKCSGGI